MKKVFEGATIVSAFLLVVTVACAFIFNVRGQIGKKKERARSEGKIVSAERKRAEKDREHQIYIQSSKDQIEYYKNLSAQPPKNEDSPQNEDWDY